jgi:hypothetical protein
LCGSLALGLFVFPYKREECWGVIFVIFIIPETGALGREFAKSLKTGHTSAGLFVGIRLF